MDTMTHRPFSELTKDWPPERLAEVKAKTARLLEGLNRPARKQTPTEEASQEASEKAPDQSPELAR